jgi:hypothetical protein
MRTHAVIALVTCSALSHKRTLLLLPSATAADADAAADAAAAARVCVRQKEQEKQEQERKRQQQPRPTTIRSLPGRKSKENPTGATSSPMGTRSGGGAGSDTAANANGAPLSELAVGEGTNRAGGVPPKQSPQEEESATRFRKIRVRVGDRPLILRTAFAKDSPQVCQLRVTA